jgi:hypothetical protein
MGNLALNMDKGRAFVNTAMSPRVLYRGADKSLARPRRTQATAKEDFYFHVSYL